ncbi:hypothetical protein Tco_0210617 [Tanacetum coccineum]
MVKEVRAAAKIVMVEGGSDLCSYESALRDTAKLEKHNRIMERAVFDRIISIIRSNRRNLKISSAMVQVLHKPLPQMSLSWSVSTGLIKMTHLTRPVLTPAENCDNYVFYIVYASHLESKNKIKAVNEIYDCEISRLHCIVNVEMRFFLQSDSSQSDDYGETGQYLFETSMVGSPFISRRKRDLLQLDVPGLIIVLVGLMNGQTPINALMNKRVNDNWKSEVDDGIARLIFQECGLKASWMMPVRDPLRSSSYSDCTGVVGCSLTDHIDVTLFSDGHHLRSIAHKSTVQVESIRTKLPIEEMAEFLALLGVDKSGPQNISPNKVRMDPVMGSHRARADIQNISQRTSWLVDVHTVEDDIEVFSTEPGLDWISTHNFLTCLQKLSSYASGHLEVSELAACLEKASFSSTSGHVKVFQNLLFIVILEVL